MLRILIAITPLFLLLACNRDTDDNGIDPAEESTIIEDDAGTTVDFPNGNIELYELESLLNEFAVDEKSMPFKHVTRSGSNYLEACPEDYNGILTLHLDEETISYFGLGGPVLEHNTHETFMYIIENAFFIRDSKELELKARFIESNGEGFYVDMSYAPEKFTFQLGSDTTALVFNQKTFIPEHKTSALSHPDCPEHH